MALRAQFEPQIEVHKYRWPAVAGVAFLAVVVRAFVPKYYLNAELLDLPLLATLYFALSRRNPATGLLLGMGIGLLQDGVSRVPIGLYGIAKTLVGYAGSTIGGRLDVEHPISRFFLTFCFFHFHQVTLELIRRVLLAKPEVFFSVRLLEASLITAAVAVGLFPLLDKLRMRT
ncbi:MAG: rod shape-determining protein MreD [Acidobacteria bacterium]|nr:rod shape-determining protein MreD [Acidobacteriota bacterium]MCL5287865.1 rod shape-determining protein MreD [Acidobacteriota bacterium]